MGLNNRRLEGLVCFLFSLTSLPHKCSALDLHQHTSPRRMRRQAVQSIPADTEEPAVRSSSTQIGQLRSADPGKSQTYE